MKTILCFVLGLSSLMALAATQVGNGGGIAEQNFTFAYLNMKKYFSVCYKTRLCQLSLEEDNIVQALMLRHDKELIAQPQLIFTSSKESPNTFDNENHVHRLAVTGNNVGNEIYINTDFIFKFYT